MEQKTVKVNKKAFAIVYFVNGHKTTIFKLASTNGKQALQTFIRHHWNGLKYDYAKVCGTWVAVREGFASLIAEELL